MNVSIQNIQDIAPDLRILHIKPEKKFTYKAGQYINIISQGFEPRSYSIASAPQEDNMIELHIRRKGQLSTHLCDTLNIGDKLSIEGPFGTNTYKAQCKKPILALAGGSGLTQIKALVEKALSTTRETPVHLYHGARDLSGLYQDDYFKNLMKDDHRLIYHPVISDETPEDETMKYGFLAEHVEKDFGSLKNFRAYICGNPEMIPPLKQVLLAKGIDPNRIHSDG